MRTKLSVYPSVFFGEPVSSARARAATNWSLKIVNVDCETRPLAEPYTRAILEVDEGTWQLG